MSSRFNPIRVINTIFSRGLDGTAWVAGALMIIIMLMVNMDVFMRYFLSRPQGYVGETAEYMVLFLTFLAAAWVLKVKAHVRMNLVVSRLNPRASASLDAITSIIGAIIFFLIGYYSLIETISVFQKGIIISGSVLRPVPPKWIIIFPISFGSFLLVIQCLKDVYNNFSKQRVLGKEKKGIIAQDEM